METTDWSEKQTVTETVLRLLAIWRTECRNSQKKEPDGEGDSAENICFFALNERSDVSPQWTTASLSQMMNQPEYSMFEPGGTAHNNTGNSERRWFHRNTGSADNKVRGSCTGTIRKNKECM